MIVWIFFPAGAGGDGFANLLEQSSNVVALDQNKHWRVHRYVNSQAKFWAPTLGNTEKRINTIDQLNNQQFAVANSDDQYLVITSHDLTLKTTFLNNTFLDQKHIKILLKPKDSVKSWVNYKHKNLVEFNRLPTTQPELNPLALLNFTVHLESVPTDWKDIKKLTDTIGLNLDEKDFIHYRKIVTGEFQYTTPGIEYYESYIDADNVTKYKKIN
jgi:hypothetical protein